MFANFPKQHTKRRIPPPKAGGDFAPGNTADRLKIGEYSVSRKRRDQIAYAQKALTAKKRTDAVAAGARRKPGGDPQKKRQDGARRDPKQQPSDTQAGRPNQNQRQFEFTDQNA